MDRLRHNTVLRAVKLLDAILLTIPFGLCWYGVYAGSLAEPYFQKGNWLVIALFLVLYITYGRIYEGFRITLSRISEMIVSQALSALIADGILYLVTWLLTRHLPPVLPMLGGLRGADAAGRSVVHTGPPVVLWPLRGSEDRGDLRHA